MTFDPVTLLASLAIILALNIIIAVAICAMADGGGR